MLPAYVGESGQAALVEFIPRGIELLTLLSLNFYQWVVPAVVGGALILGLLFWLILWLVVKADLGRAEKPAPAPQGKKGKKDFLAQKMEQERKRRLFLHTLSVLQREGRLLDFFAEDLNQYEDDQIGAAVRSIQDDCKRAVKKYINPVPVIDKEEGDAVTIEPGFDMDAIALVGNVTGEPPFEGILRHPGWKAAKKELPKLSDIQDPGIMVPAEVEIQ
ncbi:MAG: DUF2760 domain-containing protein [Desulfobacterales bacterium]|nr:DUF2760 domain-containing protein [Desulfobacterales bacterium]